MAFRSSEYLQRYELVRFQLDDIIGAPKNNQYQEKNETNLQLMTDLHFTIDIMDTWRFVFSYIK